VLDANGQALVYVYARETLNEVNIAGVLTFDEARRIAVNVAKLRELHSAALAHDPRVLYSADAMSYRWYF
jgi:hypothetical protein